MNLKNLQRAYFFRIRYLVEFSEVAEVTDKRHVARKLRETAAVRAGTLCRANSVGTLKKHQQNQNLDTSPSNSRHF